MEFVLAVVNKRSPTNWFFVFEFFIFCYFPGSSKLKKNRKIHNFDFGDWGKLWKMKKNLVGHAKKSGWYLKRWRRSYNICEFVFWNAEKYFYGIFVLWTIPITLVYHWTILDEKWDRHDEKHAKVARYENPDRPHP